MEIQINLRERILGFIRDLKSVLQALRAWGSLYIIAEVVLGLLPVVIVVTLGLTIDAMAGARGIGVVTSDVNAQLLRWLLIMIAGFLSYLFSIRFTGKAAEVGRSLRDVVIFGSLLVYLLAVQQVFLVLAYIIFLAVDLVFIHDFRIRLGSLAAIVTLGVIIAQSLVRFTVLRSFTVGEGIAMVSGIAAFIICFKLRVARG